jgi:hypothetical protein
MPIKLISMTSAHDPRFQGWLEALETRHLAELTFAEVSRALRSLSATYVGRRGKLGQGAALSGAGKRAAFALFYGPLHFLLVREIVRSLGLAAERAGSPGGARSAPVLIDLGCGTGAAGAAWASQDGRPPALLGIDRHPWALEEAAWTYRHFGLRARVRRGDLARVEAPRGPAAWVAAFTLNELPAEARDAVLSRLLARAGHGDRVLIVEPVARAIAPWWDVWRDRFLAAGGRADEWRVRLERPEIVARLDRAAGLDHRELTGRSLSIGRT